LISLTFLSLFSDYLEIEEVNRQKRIFKMGIDNRFPFFFDLLLKDLTKVTWRLKKIISAKAVSISISTPA